MKMKLLSLVLPFLFLNSVVAQHTYIPIPEDSVLWITIVEDHKEGQPGNPPHTFDYWVSWFEDRDTLVNGTNYSCLFSKHNTELPFSYGSTPAKFSDWIIQDSINKKVWYKRNKFHTDPIELLYDFSLKLGDTIADTNMLYYKNILPYKAWVNAIDSIFWVDGTWRYRWFINTNYGPDWGKPTATVIQIEGMGHITHFINDPLRAYHPLVSRTHEVSCFQQRQQWLYVKPNLWNFDCDSMVMKNMLSPTNIKNLVHNELEQPILYPNPAVDYLILNNYAVYNGEECILNAYDNLGRNIIKTFVQPGQRISIDRSNIQSGIYYFMISTKRGLLLHQQKVIIQ